MAGNQTTPCQCPSCQRMLTGAIGLGHENPPEPGDLSICLYCGAMLVIADDLTVVPGDEADLDEEGTAMLAFLRATMFPPDATRH